MAPSLKQELRELVTALASVAPEEAKLVRQAIDGTEEALQSFLTSNELWGGSGSIADQAGLNSEGADRSMIESALIKLGVAQMGLGVVNARTETWVNAFSRWHREGI